jgi:acetyltransferase
MSIRGLYKLFFPSSVAVIGIDEDPDGLGRRILLNIKSANFKGSVYPISETVAKIDGLSTYANLAAATRPIDLAVLALPLEQVPAAIDVCAQAGVSGVVILARNAAIEKTAPAILQRARTTGVRVIGPRSWGIVSPWVGLNAGFGQQLPIAGELAVISQSAAVCASILDLSVTKQIGLSLLVGLGDMLEADCADLMDATANHYRVGAILLHVEHISDMRKFMSAARAASRIKPIVVLKTGRSACLEKTPFTMPPSNEPALCGLQRLKISSTAVICSANNRAREDRIWLSSPMRAAPASWRWMPSAITDSTRLA